MSWDRMEASACTLWLMALLSHCLLPDTSRSLQECLTIVLGAEFLRVYACVFVQQRGRDGQRQSEVFSESISIICKECRQSYGLCEDAGSVLHEYRDMSYVTLKYKQDCSCSSVALSGITSSSVKTCFKNVVMNRLTQSSLRLLAGCSLVP